MQAYRTSRRPRATTGLLCSLQTEAGRLAGAPPRHEEIRDLLVAFDELEAAVADALNPDADGEGAVEAAFRRAALALGRAFLLSWDGRAEAAREGLRRLAEELSGLSRFDLPPTVLADEAEGYAWYALYPETYLAAARRFQAEVRPEAAVCLGIRQIGASLSAVVAATLGEDGCPVRLHTVRPRGNPFQRAFLPSPTLAADLRAQAARAHFLVIDEGPGLSGSSFCSVADVLSEWGIPDRRILFFPSWIPDGSGFASPAARRRWRRHRKYADAFEDTVLSRLARALPGRRLLDWSGGRWRRQILPCPADYPPVQPQHERRKYLAFDPAHPFPSAPEGWRNAAPGACVLAKFAGLGRRGRAAVERARRLAESGFAPPVLGAAEGFLLTPLVPGRPATWRDGGRLILPMAEYLAFLREHFPAADATPSEALLEMLRINVGEGLGESWIARLHHLPFPPPGAATEVDGRMFPHEWVVTREGAVKTDGFDHHDDHFFPGGTDIAWDLAAAAVEFRLDLRQTRSLLGRYAALSGDEEPDRRLRFHRLSYLAFRLGYTRLAASSLGTAPDGDRFRQAARRYGRLLQIALERPEVPAKPNWHNS